MKDAQEAVAVLQATRAAGRLRECRGCGVGDVLRIRHVSDAATTRPGVPLADVTRCFAIGVILVIIGGLSPRVWTMRLASLSHNGLAQRVLSIRHP